MVCIRWKKRKTKIDIDPQIHAILSYSNKDFRVSVLGILTNVNGLILSNNLSVHPYIYLFLIKTRSIFIQMQILLQSIKIKYFKMVIYKKYRDILLNKCYFLFKSETLARSGDPKRKGQLYPNRK